MRISDWSSDVCSSDLAQGGGLGLVVAVFLQGLLDGGAFDFLDVRGQGAAGGVARASTASAMAAQAASSILAGLPSFAANVTSMSRLNLSALPRVRSDTRPWLTPSTLAAAPWVILRALFRFASLPIGTQPGRP